MTAASPSRAERRAVLIDKDGTLVVDVPFNIDPARLEFTPGAVEALRLLQDDGFAIVIVTNQPGIGLMRFSRKDFAVLERALLGRLAEAGVRIESLYLCPHRADERCLCRKPAPGLLLQATRALGLDLHRSWMIGDILDDVEAGHRAGCRTVLLDVGSETEWRRSPMRTPDLVCPDLLDAARRIVAAGDVPGATARTSGAAA